MQGHRSSIGSLPETLDFDHGSSSSNPAIDQQMCWSNMMSPGDHGLPDFILPPGDAAITCLNSVGHEGQNLSRWNLGEPSSSNRHNEANHDERKVEHGWSSLMSVGAGLGPRLEEPQREPSSIFLQNNDNGNISTNQIVNGPLFMQSSWADVAQNINLNAGFVGHVDDDCQVMESPNCYKSSGSLNGQITSASSSDPFGVPSGSDGYLVEENDVRLGCSLEGRRLSCKRKAIEGNVGQSSASGSSRCFQRAESIGWQAAPSRSITGRSLSISSPSENISGPSPLEHVNPRRGLGLRAVASGSHPDSNMAGCAENSQRNLRARNSLPCPQDHVPINLVPTGSTYTNLNASSTQQSRIFPGNHSLDLSSVPPADNTHPQSQPPVIHVPALPQNVQSVRWNGDYSSRLGSSTSSIVHGERIAAPHDEGSLRNMSRHIMENPLFIPVTGLRNLAQRPTSRTLTGGSTSIPGNGASTSRSGTSSGVHSSSAPTWVPHRNPSSLNPRRLSEYVRRSLISVGSDSGGRNGSHSPLHSGVSAFTQEAGLSSAVNNQGNHHTHPRSLSLMERQGDGAHGAPYSLQTLASASGGRSRIVSEIRSVLDLMRRGEGLRFEDVMILDQSSMLFGVADGHDRHRDMRLDVDNMSYEELLALEERIGNVSTGLSEETISFRLKQRKYVAIAIEAQSEAEPCSICREEYNSGEDLGILECGHDFHTGCIKQWLTLKNLCPICKTTALVT